MNYAFFCKSWLDSWTGNRPVELIKFYHPDVFYSDPAKRNGLRGHSELLPYFEKLLDINPDWQWQALEIIETAKGFTLKWQATIPAGNTILTETGLDIVEVKDGLIVRNEVYFDRTNWLRAFQG